MLPITSSQLALDDLKLTSLKHSIHLRGLQQFLFPAKTDRNIQYQNTIP